MTISQTAKLTNIEFEDTIIKLYEPKVGAINQKPYTKNYPRSPLRYPGGKNRAVEIICSFIPNEEKVLCLLS